MDFQNKNRVNSDKGEKKRQKEIRRPLQVTHSETFVYLFVPVTNT